MERSHTQAWEGEAIVCGGGGGMPGGGFQSRGEQASLPSFPGVFVMDLVYFVSLWGLLGRRRGL